MLTKEGKRSAIIHSVLFVAWIGLLVLASFKDWEISKALSYDCDFQRFVGATFAIIGEWPSYLMVPSAALILFYNVENMTDKKGGRTALYILFGILHFVGWFLLFQGGEFMPTEIAFTIVYSILAGVPCLYFAKFVSRDTMQRLFKFAVFMVIVLVVSRLIVTVMKLIWSRARFRDMIAPGGNPDLYTPWYHVNGFRKIEGYKLTSFPSGHVTSACNLFVIVVLCEIVPALKNKKTLLYIICSLFVVFTMFYRVVFNAHFLSDTLWAALISYGTFYVTKAIFFKGGKYTFEDKKKQVEATDEPSIDNDEVVEEVRE